MDDIYRPDRIRDTFERLIKNLPGFVYRCRNDFDWTMIFVSDQCEKITGYTPDELINSDIISYNEVIEPSYRESLHLKWKKIISEKAVLKEEYCIVRKDGSIGLVLEHGRGVFDETTGVLLYLDGYILDITERVESFNNLIRINEELRISNIKREEANSLKSFFLSNLSHEIRTPINAIMGFTEILKEDGLAQSDKNDYIDIILRSSSTLLSIIDDIVIASKIETNQLNASFSTINLNVFFTIADKELHAFIPNKTDVKISINTHLTNFNSNINIRTDQLLFTDIVKRLFENAIRFTEQGHIEAKLYVNNECVVFEIKDSGIGIDPIYHEQIFKSFYRVEHPINTRTRGAGLGLYISKAYASLIGARIFLISQERVGSTFSLHVPFDTNPVKEEIFRDMN